MSTDITTYNESKVSVVFNDYETKISTLTDVEKTKYLALTEQMNIHDIASIQSYGNELSNTISRNGDTILSAVRGNNTSEVVQLTNDILAQLNIINLDDLKADKGFKGFLRKIPIIKNLVTSYENMMIKYDTVKDNITNIADKISTSKAIALRDNNTLQVIFDSNVAYIKQLQELIIAAKLKQKEVENQLIMMQNNPEQYAAYQINDLQIFVNTLGKKIADMQTTEYVLNQDLLSIRATQTNNYAIVDKADNIVSNIIPIWKGQIATTIIMDNQRKSVEAQKLITDTTNKLLLEKAKLLKMNSIAVAKANEESIISIDTLKETTQSLIDTIKEVRNIHEEGAKERMQLEHHLTDFAKAIQEAMAEQKFGK